MTAQEVSYGGCSSCGEPAYFLVTVRIYEPEAGDAGRLMKYCQRCRDTRIDMIATCIPLDFVERDRSAVMKLLYALGATLTDPQTAAEVLFGDPDQAWVPVARRHEVRL